MIKEGYVETKEVSVSLNEMIGADIELFLDILEELFFADLEEEDRVYALTDITYTPVAVNEYGMIVLQVSGIPIKL